MRPGCGRACCGSRWCSRWAASASTCGRPVATRRGSGWGRAGDGAASATDGLRQGRGAAGAEVIVQARGTAPGVICPVTIDGVGKVLYAVPGVPHEMKEMVERAILPDLHARSGEVAVIASRTLRTWGDSES